MNKGPKSLPWISGISTDVTATLGKDYYENPDTRMIAHETESGLFYFPIRKQI